MQGVYKHLQAHRVPSDDVDPGPIPRRCLLAYCIMPNHWHLIVWPRQDGELSRFVGWLTLTHTQPRHAHRHTRGNGHVYQGRFNSFPVQCDEHFLTACRYVERNALRANLVTRAENFESPGLDNVRLAGVSAAVPEPSTLTMMALAGVTLVMFRHRRSPVRSQ